MPVDISAQFLHQQMAELRREYPERRHAAGRRRLHASRSICRDAARVMPRVGFFPGSTIGNFEPHEAAAFLRHAGRILGRGATFIVGVDLVKDAQVLQKAYNDSQGVTAKFNLNLLARINRELGAKFNLACFEHHAFFNRERSRIEMHLASLKRQRVKVCGECIEFRAGETIHTENSYKYSVESFRALARGAGWTPAAVWTDADDYFSVHALTLRAERFSSESHSTASARPRAASACAAEARRLASRISVDVDRADQRLQARRRSAASLARCGDTSSTAS